jgi:hypothetical protein
MQSGRYHVKSPTIAIFDDENGVLAVRMVPAGAIITIEGPGAENDRLIDVMWDGKRVMMFTRDLKSRAQLDEESQ